MYRGLAEFTPSHPEALRGSQAFYRAFSLANGGGEVETDLLA